MAGSIAGTLIRGDLRPEVPKFNKIDAGAEQSKAISNNLKNLPGAENLASQTSTFNQEQIQKMLEAAIPNYQALVSGVSGNIESMVRGDIPKDVQNMLQMKGAGQALAGGYTGTGMAHNLEARDLGLTSLDLIQKGISTAGQWLQQMNSIYAPGTMNVTSMFLTPEQQISHDVSERDKKWDVAWLRNQIKAQPGPVASAFAGLFDNIEQIGRSVLTSYAGGAMGGGGGAPSGGGGGGGGGGGFGGENAATGMGGA